MHRELTHADEAFAEQPRLSLYLLTAVVGLLLLADLWPWVASWLDGLGLSLPTWPSEIRGYRIALLAALLGGARVLHGSLDSLLQGRIGADLALAIATVAAILLREPLVAAELVFVGLLGECLENVTFERTRRELRKLAELSPRRCWRLRDGVEERVLVSELAVDDAVVVKPGGRIPADGVVTDGRSSLDLSPLTGESLPVERGPGDEVLAGALNLHGALTLRVSRVAEHTVLGRVLEMTARALKDRGRAERTADAMARWFLPAVLALAAVTFVVAYGLHAWGVSRAGTSGLNLAVPSWRFAAYPALSVLVVACPCALILATPAAVIAALGRLAGTGVLLKSGSALERLAAVQAVAFDKTGTLTEGRLEIGDIVPIGDLSREEILRLAASAEQGSEHPLAALLVAEGNSRPLSLSPSADFLAHPGGGVSATLPEGRAVVGTLRLLTEQGSAMSDDVAAAADRLAASGQTVLAVSVNSTVVGLIGARDRVRDDAAVVVAELKRLGLTRLSILTGDREAVGVSVGSAVGIDDVHASLLPQDKADRVAATGVPTAMIGDGINDAPALARASVGLAVGGTTNDVAAETGDVVLMLGPSSSTRSPLRHLPLLFRLSRETVKVIRQNIVYFAFGANLVGVVLTAWLWPLLAPPAWQTTGPLAAVIYHQLGSLLVLINSMRLLWFERTPPSAKWRTSLDAANSWLERNANVEEWLHEATHRWRETMAVVACLSLAAYGLSGFCTVGPDEVGLVRRFGRPLPGDLEPGLHWRWPWPVEALTRFQPARVRTVEIGFRTAAGVKAAPGSRSWSSVHGGDGVVREPGEAVMITGDGDLLEVQGSVRYAVPLPRVYLFDAGDPERAIRNAAESVLRDVVAGKGMAALLTAGRGAFQDEVTRRLTERLAEIHPRSLGVRLDGVSLHDLHPPGDVVSAYHDVTRAMEQRDREINDAKTTALARVREQEARNLGIVRQAEADKMERVTLAMAKLDEFRSRLRVRQILSWADEAELFVAMSDALAAGRTPAEARRSWVAARETRLATNRALTDFRVYWDNLAASLSGRPKLLIDTDRLPGRRTMWLLPDPPPFAPARRSPTEREP